MRPIGSATELERRRRRAVESVEAGESPTLVARILGVAPSSLHRWRRLSRWPNGHAFQGRGAGLGGLVRCASSRAVERCAAIGPALTRSTGFLGPRLDFRYRFRSAFRATPTSQSAN